MHRVPAQDRGTPGTGHPCHGIGRKRRVDMAIVGLVLDGGVILRARSSAFDIAAESARAGAQELQQDALAAGPILVDASAAHARIAAYLASKTLSPSDRKRLTELIPAIHAEKTKFYSSFVADGAVPLREGVARLMEEALTAGCRLGIASTTTAANIDALLGSTPGPRAVS